MKLLQIIFIGLSAVMMVSCVSSKKLKYSQKENKRLENRCRELAEEDKKTEAMFMADEATIRSYKERASLDKIDSTQDHREINNLSDIDVYQRQHIDKQNAYIRQLVTYVDHKDSINNKLVADLKYACGDNKEVIIKTEKGVVYVDIADRLLFNSGKYIVTEKAREVLAKIAVVLQKEPTVKFSLEGHTDNAPFNDGGILLDNWDLSVKRATSVIRILQKEYHISPTRMSASGYGEYAPSMSNNTKAGMAENRTTRIVITPQMDEMYTAFQRPKY